jgi:hypothetical protein
MVISAEAGEQALSATDGLWPFGQSHVKLVREEKPETR